MSWFRRPDRLEALLRAAVSTPEFAREGWAEWIAERPIDRAGWEEIRLLGVVAGRSEHLGVGAAERPQLEGIRRFVWSRTQMKIAGALPVLRRWAGKDIPFCLLKGTALIAGGHLEAGERFIRDVDVLVPRSRIAQATETLLGAGWKAERYCSLDEVFSLGFPRCHALGFRSPGDRDGAIDLHLSAVSLNKFVASDAALWSRATEVKLFGLSAFAPSAEDLLCLCLIHSYLSDRQQGLDWAIDAAALASREDFDWPLFFEESYRRGAEVLVRERIRQLLSLRAVSLPVVAREQVDRTGGEGVFLKEFDALAGKRFPLPWTNGCTHRDCKAARARRILEVERSRPPEAAPSLPPASAWLRTDIPLPAGFAASPRTRSVRISGRILGARVRTPIRFRLYCGSTRLGGGRTLPLPALGRGGVHALRIRADLDPAIVSAEGRAPLSLYFGRRSRVSGVLDRDTVVQLERVWLG